MPQTVDGWGTGHMTQPNTPEQDALHWLIMLQEDPDDADLRGRFDAWHALSAENRRAWDDAQHVWDVLGAAQPLAVSRPPAWRARRAAVYAFGVMALCVGLWFAPVIGTWMAADHSTTTAQTRDVQLSDGSIVSLGADSAIEIAFTPELRRVRLLSGEAFFNVQPDTTRPFQVGAGDVDTTVLGTAFDVRLSSGGVAVSVNHGRVAVSGTEVAPDLAPLGAGDWVRVGRDGGIERGNDEPELAGGWRTGMLVVKDRSVADVIDEMRRYYGGAIVFAGAAIGDKRVTGVYDLRSPVDAVRAVVQAHGAQARQITPWLTVISSF